MATIESCSGCSGTTNPSTFELSTHAPITHAAWVTDDKVCVEFDNSSGSTNMSANLWAEDDETHTGVSDENHWVEVPAGATVCQTITGFGHRDDQTTPIDSTTVHLALYNRDDETQGAHLYVTVN